MSKPIEHLQYKKITENSDFFFFVNSNSLNEDIAFIKENEIKNVCLSQHENYSLLNVLPVIDINCIRNLRIYVKKIDLKGVNNLTSLEELSVGEEFFNLALDNLFKLRFLYLTNGKFTGLHSLINLKELTIVNGDAAALSINNFTGTLSLETLSIYNTKGKIDFSFLLKLYNLRKLDLYNIKSKVDIRLFNSFADKIVELKIEKCKMLEHFEDCLNNFNSLKYFSLIDSVAVSNAEVIQKLKSIEIAVILGASYFVDGNIDQLINLKHVSVDDKKHYSLKSYQLPKLPHE